MGWFKNLNVKLGHSHIKGLVKQGVGNIVNTLRILNYEADGGFHIDDSLDRLIEEGVVSCVDCSDIESKFKGYLSYYVVIKLGRDIDWLNNDKQVMDDEIEMYWTRIQDKLTVMTHG